MCRTHDQVFLDEDPILNNVPTYQCRKPADPSYVLANMKDLVVKCTRCRWLRHAGGSAATAKEVEDFAAVVKANPTNYIAQPTLSLSSCRPLSNPASPAILIYGHSCAHRPRGAHGAGGLTQVALREGSLVVNSRGGRHQGHLGVGDASTTPRCGGQLIMLSRVAAHLYWMSRYLERAENMARILDVTQSLAMLDRSADSVAP